MTGIATKFRVCAKQVLCFLTSKIGDAAHLDVRSRLINLYSFFFILYFFLHVVSEKHLYSVPLLKILF